MNEIAEDINSVKKRFVKQWTLMMVPAFVLGFSIPMIFLFLIVPSDTLGIILSVVGFGIPIIGLQSFVLRKWTGFAVHWLLSWLFGAVPGFFVTLVETSSGLSEDPLPLYGYLVSIIGFTIGEWVILRAYVPNSFFWITTNALAWIAALIVFIFVLFLFIFSHYCWYEAGGFGWLICILLPAIISGLISGYLYGSITARFFTARLFDPAPKDSGG